MKDRVYMGNVPVVAQQDVSALEEKDREYGGSWLKRGGVGAFMMLARKHDRLETHGADAATREVWARLEEACRLAGYDVFAAIEGDTREESVLDDIRDLRRYLLLVEAEWLTRQQEHVGETR